jgi:nucleotide-binding universal stress UspA family protein
VFEHIWVAVDGGGDDGSGLRVAMDLARCTGARVTVCHVLGAEDDEPVDDRDALAHELLGAGAAARCRARTTATALGSSPVVDVVPCVVRGRWAEVLADLVRRARADLVVIASPRRPRGRLGRLLGGDPLRRVLDHAACPILVIPARRSGGRPRGRR